MVERFSREESVSGRCWGNQSCLEIEQKYVEGNWEEGESNIGCMLLGRKSNNSRTGVVRIGKIYYLII